MKKTKSTVNVAHAREKRPVYEQIVRDKVCPFCVDFASKTTVPKYHTKPILFHGTHWVVTENFNAYAGTQHHFLLVHRKHIVSFSELKTPALTELVQITKKLEKKFSLPAGVLLVRFGDTHYTGGSVNHFHLHFVLGVKKKGKNSEPLLLFAGYKDSSK